MTRLHRVGDEFLVVLAQRGRVDAVDELVRRYTRRVWRRANCYFLAGGEREDLVAVGLAAVHEAILTFDPARGRPFSVLVEIVITRRIQTAVRTATRGKHSPLNRADYLDAPLRNLPHGDATTLGDAVADRALGPPEVLELGEELAAVELATFRDCSDLQRRCFSLFTAGYSQAEISARLGIRRKTVDNALQYAKRKARHRLRDAA